VRLFGEGVRPPADRALYLSFRLDTRIYWDCNLEVRILYALMWGCVVEAWGWSVGKGDSKVEARGRETGRRRS